MAHSGRKCKLFKPTETNVNKLPFSYCAWEEIWRVQTLNKHLSVSGWERMLNALNVIQVCGLIFLLYKLLHLRRLTILWLQRLRRCFIDCVYIVKYLLSNHLLILKLPPLKYIFRAPSPPTNQPKKQWSSTEWNDILSPVCIVFSLYLMVINTILLALFSILCALTYFFFCSFHVFNRSELLVHVILLLVVWSPFFTWMLWHK